LFEIAWQKEKETPLYVNSLGLIKMSADSFGLIKMSSCWIRAHKKYVNKTIFRHYWSLEEMGWNTASQVSLLLYVKTSQRSKWTGNFVQSDCPRQIWVVCALWQCNQARVGYSAINWVVTVWRLQLSLHRD